jgi:hypothetical protein
MNYALRLPDSLMEQVKRLAKRDKVSMNQFMLTAIAEKTSAMATEEFFAERAARGSRARALDVLRKVERIGNPAIPEDEVPVSVRTRKSAQRGASGPGRR